MWEEAACGLWGTSLMGMLKYLFVPKHLLLWPKMCVLSPLESVLQGRALFLCETLVVKQRCFLLVQFKIVNGECLPAEGLREESRIGMFL